MFTNRFKRILPLIVILIIIFPVLILFIASSNFDNINYSLRNLIYDTKRKNSIIGPLIQFKSNFPNYTLSPDPVNQPYIQSVLKKMDRYPMVNIPYFGRSSNNQALDTITPKTILFEFHPITQWETDLTENKNLGNDILLKVPNGRNSFRAIFVRSMYDVNSSLLTIPIYVDVSASQDYRQSENIYLSKVALQALFFNLQKRPVPHFSDSMEEFSKTVGLVELNILEITGKTTFLNIPQIQIIKKANAAVCGYITCGVQVAGVRECSGGPYPGKACDGDPECAGGSCNQVSGSPRDGGLCDFTNTTSDACFGPANCSGPLNHDCNGCDIGSCSRIVPTAISTVRPSPTRVPTLIPSPTPPPPPGCTWGGWSAGVCRGGPCGADERYQTRTTNPLNCVASSQCVYDPSCIPPTIPPNTPTPTNTPTPPVGTPTPTRTPGNIQARCKLLTAGASCSDIASSATVPCDISLAPGLSPTSKSTSGSGYASWSNIPVSVPYRTYTVSGTATGLAVKNACWKNSNGTSCPPGANPDGCSGFATVLGTNETVTWDIGLGPQAGWTRSQGGDVTVCKNIKSIIPPGALPSQSFVLNGLGGFPGIVSYGNGFSKDFDGAGGGNSFVSPPRNWLVEETPSAICGPDWYDYFYNKMDLRNLGTDNKSPVLSTYASKLIWKLDGPFNMSQDWNLVNQKLVIFVNGDVNINANITLTGNSFFALIVDGNITVSQTVGNAAAIATPNLQGVYITSKGHTFATGQSILPNPRLVVKGTVIAGGGFILERDLDVTNATTPGEEFIYDPSLLVNMPDAFKTYRVNWQEVAP